MKALPNPDTREDGRRGIRRLSLIGLGTVLLLIGGIGGWMATAQLSGAVIANGVLVVETNVKAVQHPQGGVVGEINVEEGSVVAAGDIVVRLDDTIPRASWAIYRSQIDDLLGREARLTAELTGESEITFPDELLARRDEPAIARLLAGEISLFEARARTLAGQRAQLAERIEQIGQEIAGLTAQADAKTSELEMVSTELVGVRDLFSQNLVPVTRVSTLERDEARLMGEEGQLAAEIARARGRIIETNLQINQIDDEFRNQALGDLSQIQGQLAELQERLTAAEDQLSRVNIRAPQDGIVHELSVFTVGGVIGAGETIMEIIPSSDALVVDARIAPPDIDQVALGAPVRLHIMAGNQRVIPEVNGTVTRVAADLTEDQQTGQSFYVVRAEMVEGGLEMLGDLVLVPGMPATAYIQTTDRTPLQYMMQPLYEQISRTFRER